MCALELGATRELGFIISGLVAQHGLISFILHKSNLGFYIKRQSGTLHLNKLVHSLRTIIYVILDGNFAETQHKRSFNIILLLRF